MPETAGQKGVTKGFEDEVAWESPTDFILMRRRTPESVYQQSQH